MSELYYVYAIGRPDLLAGRVPEDGSLQLAQEGALAAVVALVPEADFSEEALAQRMDDTEWLTQRALEHQSVVDRFSNAGVIPLRFGSVFRSEEQVREMLSRRQSELDSLIDKTFGHEEWGLNVYIDNESLLAFVLQSSPELAELAKKIEEATPGQAFLLRKKSQAVLAQLALNVKHAMIEDLHVGLAEVSIESKRLKNFEQASADFGALAARFAFLVKTSAVDPMQQRAARAASQYCDRGLTLELIGPWPVYSFLEGET